MSETQTVNLKEIAESMKAIKEFMAANAKPESGAKGIVENAPAGSNTKEEQKAKVRKAFKEFLGNDAKKHFDFKEAIGAVSAGSAEPSIWSASPELLSPAGADGYFLTDIVTWKDDVKGKPGQQVYVQTVAAVAKATITSGTEPTFTASTISSVPVTLTQMGHGFYVTKADLEDMQDGVMDAMITQAKNSIMRGVDDYFLSAIRANDNNARAGTITEGQAMAATCLAKLWGSLMAGSYPPAAVVMHPVPYASLLRDSQFTNAATYGGNKVVDTGVIPKYLGMDIVPLIQGTLNYGGTAGTYCTFMIAKGAMVGAIKREMEVEKEYYVKDQREYSVASIRFGGTIVHQYGIGLLTTID